MLFRTISVLHKLMPFAWSYLTHRKRLILFGQPRRIRPETHQKLAAKLSKRIGELGPTFIKLAQILSTRADLLPEIYLKELSKLQDRVPPFETSVLKGVLREEWGKPVEEVLDHFEEESLAAASLGQVHRALYRGEEVAVKVLRPGVEDLIATDLRIVMRIIAFLNRAFTSHHLRNLANIVAEFSRIIREEMDFSMEAANADRFRENLSHYRNLIIPKIYHELTTRRVVVLKFYQGVRVDEVETLRATGIDMKKVIQTLIDIYAHQTLLDGFFHADPHPGNILVDDKGNIILLDFGMVVTIDRDTRLELIRLSMAGARRDLDTIIESFYKLELVEPDVNFAVVRDATETMIRILDRENISGMRIKQLADEIYDTFYKFPLRLPSNLVYLFKTGVMVEGLGMRYDPYYNLLKGGTPVIRSMAAQLMEETGQTPVERIRSAIDEFHKFTHRMNRVVSAADREQLRVRLHPSDLMELENLLGRIVARLLLGIIAMGIAIISTMGYIQYGKVSFLLAGYSVASIILVAVFVLIRNMRAGIEKRMADRFGKDLLREMRRQEEIQKGMRD